MPSLCSEFTRSFLRTTGAACFCRHASLQKRIAVACKRMPEFQEWMPGVGNAANEEVPDFQEWEGGKGTADEDFQAWVPGKGNVSMMVTTQRPMLDSSKLAAISGPGSMHSQAMCVDKLQSSKPDKTDWPACYGVLGEPSSSPIYKIVDPDGISVDTTPLELQSSVIDMVGHGLGQMLSGSHESRISSQVTTAPASGIPDSSARSTLLSSSRRFDDEVSPSGEVKILHAARGQMSDGGELADELGVVETRSRNDSLNDLSSASQGQVILKASERIQLGGDEGRYVVKLMRSSAQQSFGLEFSTAEMRDRSRLSAIFVSDDFPCHGMSRWDRVLSINGVELRSVADCNMMLQEQLTLVLVLQSKGRQSNEPVPRPDMQWQPPLDHRLITIRKDELENESEFMLWIERMSPQLSLDLEFSAVFCKSMDQPSLFATHDVPHLHVKTGDQLLSVNGVCFPNESVLCHIFNTAISIQLKLRREPHLGVLWRSSSSTSSSYYSSSVSTCS